MVASRRSKQTTLVSDAIILRRTFFSSKGFRMQPISSETLLSQLRWRYACKKFDATRKISESDWKALEQAMVLSASSYGMQPWKFFIVTDPATRQTLLPLSWGQSQIVDASHLIVFAVKKPVDEAHIDAYVNRTAELRGVTPESLAGFKGMMMKSINGAANLNEWMTHQVYIALGQFLASAALLGIDTCPMEGFQPEKYDEALGLPKLGYASVVLATAGYRAADDKYATLPKVRFKTEDVVTPIKMG
jgi:nitroreductase